MADPEFHTPGAVDLLLGSGIFWQLICKDSILQAKGMPTLQNTLLGWIVEGELIKAKSNSSKGFCGIITNTEELQAQLERFWNQEETHEKRHFTKEKEDCKQQFIEAVRRDDTGRFIVALPKKSEIKLRDSKNQAIRRLYSLERLFKTAQDMKNAYIQFMEDYEKQQHMTLITQGSEKISEQSYILPHQPVI